MRTLLILAFLFPAQQAAAPTAREYYSELYKAGGLDRMADGYVCFYEDVTNPNFFIFGQSKDNREFMMKDGTFPQLTKEQQAGLKKDFLIVRGYAKGIPFADEQYLNKDGDSWVSDDGKLDNKGDFLRDRFTVNWQTLRFKRSVETYKPDSTFMGELPYFGRCENIATDIQQRAN